jgi:hypothetical protein
MTEPTSAELDRWNQLIHNLNGTCDDLHNFLENYEAEDLIDHMPFLQYLDNEIFLCSGCGWWYNLSDMSDDEEAQEPICNNCGGNDDD